MFLQQGTAAVASEAVHAMSGYASLLLEILAVGMMFGGASLMRIDRRAGVIFIGAGSVVTVILVTLFFAGRIGAG